MKDRAPITIHDYDAFMANADAVQAKLTRNMGAGLETFTKGTVPAFEGYSEGFMRREFQSRFELEETSQAEIHERVAVPLHNIAAEAGIGLLFAGDMIEPAHITLQTARFNPELTREQIDLHMDKIRTDTKFKMVATALTGRTIALDRLVLSPNGTIFLCASGVVPETLKARETIETLLSRNVDTDQADYISEKEGEHGVGKAPLSLVNSRDITHVVVARLGEAASEETLQQFFGKVQEFGKTFDGDPVRVRIGNVNFDTSYAIVNTIAPHLITKN